MSNLRLPLFGLLALAVLGLVALMVFSGSGGKEETIEEDGAVATAPIPPVSPASEIMEGRPAVDLSTLPAALMPTQPMPASVTTAGTAMVRSEPPKTTAGGEGSPVSYEIKAGDMIAKIAKRFGCTTADIYRLNEGMNDRTAIKIRPGQTIKVLDKTGAAPSGGTTAVSASPAATPIPASATPTGAEKPAATPAPLTPSENVLAPKPDFSRARRHTLTEKDTPFTLSRDFYGSVLHWKLIRDANPEWDSTRSEAGRVIVIPPLDGGKKDRADVSGKDGATVDKTRSTPSSKPGKAGSNLIPPMR